MLTNIDSITFELNHDKEEISFVRMSVNGKVVGFVSYRLKRHTMQLVVLDIEKEQRHKNYGTILVSFLQGVALSSGAKEINLSVLSGGSLDFWKKLGFQQVDESFFMKKNLMPGGGKNA